MERIHDIFSLFLVEERRGLREECVGYVGWMKMLLFFFLSPPLFFFFLRNIDPKRDTRSFFLSFANQMVVRSNSRTLRKLPYRPETGDGIHAGKN